MILQPQFGRVYRYHSPEVREDLLARRKKKNIPVAYISAAMLDNPIREAYRLGNYVINDDCGYAPPNGSPGYLFTASDAEKAIPLIDQLKKAVQRHMTFGQPGAYVKAHKELSGLLGGVTADLQQRYSRMISVMAREDADALAAQLRAQLKTSHVRNAR